MPIARKAKPFLRGINVENALSASLMCIKQTSEKSEPKLANFRRYATDGLATSFLPGNSHFIPKNFVDELKQQSTSLVNTFSASLAHKQYTSEKSELE